MIKSIYTNLKKYSFLMGQLILRDFKVKYKRSVLGILWSLLYPLLMMSVMALVFTNMFKFKMEGVNYLVYLMTGLIIWNYFNEATQTGMGSIISNFTLINKVYIPKYIFPLAKCLFVGINFVLSLIPLLIIILVSGNPIEGTKCYINIYYLLLPYVFLCGLMFTLGMTYMLSCFAVFLRDTIYIYGIILTIWNYFTPIFYSLEILPEWLRPIFKLNPLYIYIDSIREIIIYGRIPEVTELLMCFVSGFVVLLIGLFIFKKNQDKFINYA